MTTNAICTFDFTAKGETNTHLSIIESLSKHCKAFVFQLEKGEQTGYVHYQGRVSLNERARKANILALKDAKYSPTSREGSKNFDYVMKEDTRLEGPWSDKDTTIYRDQSAPGLLLI